MEGATISISFATGRLYERLLIPTVVEALMAYGFTLGSDYVCHQPPAEPFPYDRYETFDTTVVNTQEGLVATVLADLREACYERPVTWVNLIWATDLGSLDASLSVRVFEDDSVAVDLTFPEYAEKKLVPIDLIKDVADALYVVLRPLYGAIMIEDEVWGPEGLRDGSYSLRASWLYLGSELATPARARFPDLYQEMYRAEEKEDNGLFLASSPWPGQGMAEGERTESDRFLFDALASLFASENLP